MILLTGSTSYMGEKLLKRLQAEGEKVRCLDFDRPNDIPRGPDFIETDLLDPIALGRACKGVDTIFHFADITRAGKKAKRGYMKKVNVNGTRNLLMAAEKAGVKKFFFLSTYQVYGKVKKTPIRQDDRKKPVTPYGRDKLKAENMCWVFSKKKKMAITIFRPALISGPDIDDQVILITLYMALAMDDESRLYLSGDGANHFQLLHPDDALEAFILAYRHPASGNKAYNLGADNVMTQLEQIVKVKEQNKLDCPIMMVSPFKLFLMSLMSKPFKLTYFTSEHRFFLKHNMLLDTQLAKTDLKWNPRHDNLEILKETIDWYINRHNIRG